MEWALSDIIIFNFHKCFLYLWLICNGILRIFQVKLFQFYPFKYLNIFCKYFYWIFRKFFRCPGQSSSNTFAISSYSACSRSLETSSHLGFYLALFFRRVTSFSLISWWLSDLMSLYWKFQTSLLGWLISISNLTYPK